MHSVARCDGSSPTPLLQIDELFGETLAESAGDVAACHVAKFVAQQERVAERLGVRIGVYVGKLGGDRLGIAFQSVAARRAQIDVPECQTILNAEPLGVRSQISRELLVARLCGGRVVGHELQFLAQAAAHNGVVAIETRHLALAIEYFVANIVLDESTQLFRARRTLPGARKPLARFSILAAETTILSGSASLFPTRWNRPNRAAPSTRKCSSGSFSRRFTACTRSARYRRAR